MSVSAAAIIPPVQDSAVASLSRAARIRSRSSEADGTKRLRDRQEPRRRPHRDAGVEPGDEVVEHRAEPAMDARIAPVGGEGLDDVRGAEGEEGERVAPPGEGREGEREPLRGDLVDDDVAGVVDAAGALEALGRPDPGE